MAISKKIDFMELYSKEQKKIYLFILSMVHRQTDADDIMQQTAAEMWRMFDRFEEGTNFAAWGITIAKYRIMDYRKKQVKNRLFLSEDVYQKVVQELQTVFPSSDKRKNALRGCLSKLKESDRKMLTMHYESGFSYRQIAEGLRTSKSGIYKIMARIHTHLHECIKRTLLIWETNA